MKKRIISLILVVVMSLLALSGCAYSYEEDNMANYASFDSAKFLAALQALEIEENSFGTDEEKRWLKVEDAILNTIASKAADKTNKITDGKVGAYDILYYSYCYTITVGEGEDAKTYWFDTAKLAEASSNLQLGLSTNEAGKLAGEIEKAFADKFTFVKDDDATADKNEANYYVTSKTGKVEAKKAEDGQYVVVNVTYKVATQDEEGTSTAVKHTNEMITVPYTVIAEGADLTTYSFEQQLYGKDVGKALGTITVKNADGTSSIYTEVTVNFTTNLADSECAPVEIKGIKYEMKSSDKEDTKVTDSYGQETTAGALNGKEMVYYVFPCYYVDVEEELTVETLLYKIFGESLSTSSLEMFGANSDYKNGEDKISTLITALTTKIKEYNTAEKAKTTAESTYTTKLSTLKGAITDEAKKAKLDELVKTALEKYEAKKNATGDAVTTAKTEYDAAYKALTDYLNGTESGVTDTTKKNEFKTAYDNKLSTAEKFAAADKARTEAKDKVLGCLPSKEVMSREIVRAYRESQYDSLDSTYRNDVIDKVGHAIMDLAKKYITYNGKYPEKALKDAIKRVENELKSDFYTGKYSGTDKTLTGKTNYVAFNGSFDQYVISVSELGLKTGASKDDINAAIKAKAENAIKDVILVYVLVDCLNDNGLTTIAITEAEEKNIKTQLNNYENVYEYDFKAALMLDKVFGYLMKTSPRGDKPSKVNKPESGTSVAYELYLEQMAEYNAVNFKHVKIAAEDAE